MTAAFAAPRGWALARARECVALLEWTPTLATECAAPHGWAPKRGKEGAALAGGRSHGRLNVPSLVGGRPRDVPPYADGRPHERYIVPPHVGGRLHGDRDRQKNYTEKMPIYAFGARAVPSQGRRRGGRPRGRSSPPPWIRHCLKVMLLNRLKFIINNCSIRMHRLVLSKLTYMHFVNV